MKLEPKNLDVVELITDPRQIFSWISTMCSLCGDGAVHNDLWNGSKDWYFPCFWIILCTILVSFSVKRPFLLTWRGLYVLLTFKGILCFYERLPVFCKTAGEIIIFRCHLTVLRNALWIGKDTHWNCFLDDIFHVEVYDAYRVSILILEPRIYKQMIVEPWISLYYCSNELRRKNVLSQSSPK